MKPVAKEPYSPSYWVPKKQDENLNAQKPDPILITTLAFPVALLVGFGAKYFFLTDLLLGGLQIWIHEFGHAMVAWLGGHAATPLGLGWTNISEQGSFFVYVCFGFLLGVVGYRSFQAKAWFPFSCSIILALLQVYFTFGLNVVQFQILISYGGIGGEFYLSTLLMIAFLFHFPPKLRWDFFRFPFLLLGAFAFIHTYIQWIQISHHQASMPLGTLWGGEADAGGDMNRLMDEYGWTKQEVINVYLKTGLLCSISLLAAYGTAVARAFTTKR